MTSQTIPIVAIAPLFVIWFGFGLLPKVVIVVLVTFFPVTVALLDGFGRVDPEAMTLLRSLGASTQQTFRVAALAVGAAVAVHRPADQRRLRGHRRDLRGVRRARPSGLGIWMKLSQNSFRTDLVFAAILLTAIVSFALYLAVGVLERLVVPWAPPLRAAPAETRHGRPASLARSVTATARSSRRR